MLGFDKPEVVVRINSADPRWRRPSIDRTAAEAVALIGTRSASPFDALLPEVPKGDGHAVLVLPALFRGDPYTEAVRQFLSAIGYSAHGWDLGVNIGPTKRLLDGTSSRLVELCDEHGPVSIVGYSMGGLYARWLSMRMPERVRQVVTVCSPCNAPASNFWLPLEPLLGLWPDVDLASLAVEVAGPLPVPGAFIFSRDDGIVNSAACRDTHAADEDNIEISGRHVTIARNPEVMSIVAGRLARKPGAGGGFSDRSGRHPPAA